MATQFTSKTHRLFEVGSIANALYADDGKYYPAKVLRNVRGGIRVEWVEGGKQDTVTDLKRINKPRKAA